jgi:hypothetical protein
MPRTVEGIVEAHELAQARRRQRRPAWDGELTFMSRLAPLSKRMEEGDTTLTAQELLDAFHATAKEVRDKVPQAQGKMFASGDDDLEYFVLTLEEWTLDFIESCPDIFDEFDTALDRLYDWCDRNRWWIKPA